MRQPANHRNAFFVLGMLLVLGQSLGADLPDEACRKANVRNEPAICLVTRFEHLDIDRKAGRIDIYVSVIAGKITKPVDVFVSASAPYNPSGVQLESGSRQTNVKIRVKPGQKVSDVPVTFVRTTPANTQSGQLEYSVSAAIPDNTENIKIVNSPLRVSVRTNP